MYPPRHPGEQGFASCAALARSGTGAYTCLCRKRRRGFATTGFASLIVRVGERCTEEPIVWVEQCGAAALEC